METIFERKALVTKPVDEHSKPKKMYLRMERISLSLIGYL
jgi:hypothetical protein